jgi:anti-anti-sigma regulatory factor
MMEVHAENGRRVLKIASTHLDFAVREVFAQKLANQVADHEDVVIDLSMVRYVDHLGFEALLSAVRVCPGKVRFICPSRPIRSLFTLAHLDSLLENR